MAKKKNKIPTYRQLARRGLVSPEFANFSDNFDHYDPDGFYDNSSYNYDDPLVAAGTSGRVMP